MAEAESIDPVEEAGRPVWGACAEAHSLLSLWKHTKGCDEAIACLAMNTLERFVGAVEDWHTQMLRHGVKSLEERLSLKAQPGHQAGE